MHSRIFQISKNPVVDFIDEDRYYGGFCHSIADYVSEIPAQSSGADARDWLDCGAIKVAEDGLSFVIADRDAYFKPRHDRFVEMASKLSEKTYEEFASHTLDMDAFMVRDAYNDEFGIYVDDNNEHAGLQTLDSFMRTAQNGEKYYIGSVFDYHF